MKSNPIPKIPGLTRNQMKTQAGNSKSTESRVGAGTAGAGGGTLLVVIANYLREGHPLKSWLLLAAPSMSVSLSALWLWLQLRLAHYLRDREANSLIESAKRQLEEALQNRETSPEHRAIIRQKLEMLELVAVGRYFDRIEFL